MIEYTIAKKEHLSLITDEKYRKKGIGKKVIEMAIEYAKENNCYKVVLQSSNKRKESHIFYTKCGFDGNSKRAFEIRF
ncbi:GNAT family N-acetyltransferase [Treponema sp. R6D11]